MTDKNTTIEECKELVHTFCEERDWTKYHTPKEMAIAVLTEASELLEIFRFHDEREVEEMLQGEKRIAIEEEMADVLHCLVRMADVTGIDLASALEKKMIQNRKKYPVEKVKGKNKKYNEY